jgi:protein ImuB
MPVFPLQAAAGGLPQPATIVSARTGPLDLVVAANGAARRAGIHPLMSVSQALGRAATLAVLVRNGEAESQLATRLLAEADHISPRIQAVGPDLALMDFAGLERLHGSAAAAAARLARALGGFTLQTGIAAHPAMALIAAKCGLGEIAAGGEAAALARLPVGLLADLNELTRAFMDAAQVSDVLGLLSRWGIHTMGALAVLPRAQLAARLGPTGVQLQAIARGEALGILQAAGAPDSALERTLAFDPAISDLEVIKLAVSQAAQALTPELDRHDRVVDRCQLALGLENDPRPRLYERSFALPTREASVIAAQLQLALEHQPPARPVYSLALRCGVVHPRRVQARLFAAARPDPAKLPKLVARLGEMFGSERVGSPRLIDSHRRGAFALQPFTLPDELEPPAIAPSSARLALRAFRPPRAVEGSQMRLLRRAGPWRSQGGWWRESGDAQRWAEDEWDAEICLAGESHPAWYRLARDLTTQQYYLLGRYD